MGKLHALEWVVTGVYARSVDNRVESKEGSEEQGDQTSRPEAR